MTTAALSEDRYVDTCLLRACEAIGTETLSDAAGVAIPIEFEDPPPITLRIAYAVPRLADVSALARAMPFAPRSGRARDDRVVFARVAVVVCALVAVGAMTGAFLWSPLARALPVALAR